MKKRVLLTFVLFLSCLAAATAIEYGGSVSNRSGMSGSVSAPGFDQENELNAWVQIPITNSGITGFSAEGMYRFTWTKNDGFRHILDVERLSFYTSFALVDDLRLHIDAGRFPLSDITGLVFSQASDGVRLAIKAPAFEVSLYGGYTGLVNGQVVSIYTEKAEERTKYPYSLSPAYVPVGASMTLPNFFLGQTFSSEAFAFLDPTEDLYRIYMTAELKGPIISALHSEAATVIGTDIRNNETPTGVSNLSKLAFTYYPGFFTSSIRLDGVFASGNFEKTKPFIPFNIVSAVPNLERQDAILYSGLLKTGLSASIQPIEPLKLRAGVDFLVTMPGGGTAPSWGGWQWNVNAAWRLFSYLKLSLGAGQYIPETGKDNIYLNLKAVLEL
ncbi:MAG: hypothetical protein LBU99_05380 [Spirochaetaceae bacterium]|jgi:hypothetical protein|nr:hypothetical protein [Spirochaetaceae bacterium]